MARLSARSNPTGLKEIDRSRVSISVIELDGSRSFTLDRLDLKDTGLSNDLQVVVVARAGNTSVRYIAGTVAGLSKDSLPLDMLDRSQPLRFRVILHKTGDPKLEASVENLRARDDAQSESLLPMEPADLEEQLWRLLITDDGPILQFNSKVFPNAAGAENFVPFSALVLPEALRQALMALAEDPSRIDDENDTWNAWGPWLDTLGADRPSSDWEDAKESKSWCESVVVRFCNRFRFASQMLTDLRKGQGND